MRGLAGRFLVTGSAGFIGSHLCNRLIELGNEVIGVDSFITGREENIRSLLNNSRFELIDQDIVQPIRLKGELAGIFHLASPASPVDYIRYPIETLRAGSIGTDRILELSREKQRPILVASTSEVYGDPLEHPQKETYWGNVNPIGPRGCYDESKRYLEALTMAYHRTFGVSTHIVRIFNTYGPKMRTNDGRVVPNFCIQALNNLPLTVYGTGKQTRSFCFIDDLVEGLLRAILIEHPEPINLGNPVETTILDFAKKIIGLCNSKSDIKFVPLPQDDPRSRRPDINKAKNLIQWEPKIDIDTGLNQTLEYFQSQIQTK